MEPINKALIFVMIKDESHCIKVFHDTQMFKVLWTNDTRASAIAETPYWSYECQHNWLLKHPFLSCFTEIQLIKLKQPNPTID